MPSSRFRVEESGLDGWIRGLESMAGPPSRDAVTRWQQATDVMFDRSQQAVHVITGALKESGAVRVTRSGWNIVGTVSYGGPDAPYAVYEFGRGGSHDALTLAYVATHEMFEATLALIMEDEVHRWL